MIETLSFWLIHLDTVCFTSVSFGPLFFGFYVGYVTAKGAGHFHFPLRQTLPMPVLSATLQLICPVARSAEVMSLTDTELNNKAAHHLLQEPEWHHMC